MWLSLPKIAFSRIPIFYNSLFGSHAKSSVCYTETKLVLEALLHENI